jgi:hypothetical protein
MEKLVHEYLDSIVGDNPVLTKVKVVDVHRSNVFPVENFFVNDVRIGSKRNIPSNRLLIDLGIRYTIMDLFDLDMLTSYSYIRNWFDKFDDK